MYFLDEQNRKTKSPVYATIRDLAQDKNGNVWTIEGGRMSKYDENGNLLLNKEQRIAYRNIAVVGSMILVGLHTGLNIYDDKLTLKKTPKQIQSFKISKVVQLTDSLCVVATIGNGFPLTKNFDQFIHHQTPASNIYDVVKSGSDVWFASEKGILRSTINSLL